MRKDGVELMFTLIMVDKFLGIISFSLRLEKPKYDF